MKRNPAVVLLMVLCLTILPVTAFAAEPVEAEIPVKIGLSGEAPSSEETYRVVLQAVDEAPMPSEDTLEITGEGEASFAPISYSTPGIYCYKISQQAGDHERGTYDTTVYYVKVTVTNAENGGLETVIAAHTDAQMLDEKQEIVFENHYDPIEVPEVPEQKTVKKAIVKTGDTQNAAVWCWLGIAALITVAAIFQKQGFYAK